MEKPEFIQNPMPATKVPKQVDAILLDPISLGEPELAGAVPGSRIRINKDKAEYLYNRKHIRIILRRGEPHPFTGEVPEPTAFEKFQAMVKGQVKSWGPPAPERVCKIRITALTVVEGHKEVKVGDVIPVKASLACLLIHYGKAEPFDAENNPFQRGPVTVVRGDPDPKPIITGESESFQAQIDRRLGR